MKLIIQIPCYNEQDTLKAVINDLPREIEHIDAIEILIIDDGSTDKTVETARQADVDHIISLKTHKGLARAFAAGIEYSLKLGADIIANTDGDNQYHGGDLPKLIRPIINGQADVVIGARQIDEIPHFSFFKKRCRSWVAESFGNFQKLLWRMQQAVFVLSPGKQP